MGRRPLRFQNERKQAPTRGAARAAMRPRPSRRAIAGPAGPRLLSLRHKQRHRIPSGRRFCSKCLLKRCKHERALGPLLTNGIASARATRRSRSREWDRLARLALTSTFVALHPSGASGARDALVVGRRSNDSRGAGPDGPDGIDASPLLDPPVPCCSSRPRRSRRLLSRALSPRATALIGDAQSALRKARTHTDPCKTTVE